MGYEFVMFDSYGDGICCGYGQGEYTVVVDGVTVRESGGRFGSSETTTFCTSSGDCADSGLDISYNNRLYTCAEVKAGGFCSNPVAASHCPGTCDECAQFECADSQAPWEFTNQEATCAVLAEQTSLIATACSNNEIASTCRAICNFCEN